MITVGCADFVATFTRATKPGRPVTWGVQVNVNGFWVYVTPLNWSLPRYRGRYGARSVLIGDSIRFTTEAAAKRAASEIRRKGLDASACAILPTRL